MENNEINVKLVEMAKSGDKESISELCQKSMRLAYFMALKVLGNEADAEDIMSDTMITIVEKLKDLKEPKAYIGWMNRIVVNKCKNFLTKNKPVYLDDEGMEAAENAEIDDYNKEFLPEDCVLSKEKREVLMEIINEKTTYAERMSVLMFYYNDDSIKTIAAEMNCAEITVKTRLASARKKIKDGIEEKFGKGVTLMTTIGVLVLSKVLKAEAAEAVVPEAVAASVSASIDKATNAGQAAVTNTATSVAGEIGKKVGKEIMKKAIAGKIALGVAGAAVVVGVVAGAIALGGKSGKDADKDTGTKTKAEQMAEEVEKEAAREAEETYYYLTKKNNIMYYANANEDIITFDQYAYMDSKFCHNVAEVNDKDYNSLLVNINGENITEPGEYSGINRLNDELFIATKDDNVGVLDYKGNEVIPFEYDEIKYAEEYGYGVLVATPNEGGKYAVYNVEGVEIISSDEELSTWDIYINNAGVKGSIGTIEYKDTIYNLKDGSKVVQKSEGQRWAYNMYYTGDKVIAYDENLEESDTFELDNFFDFVWDFDREYCKIRTKDEEYYYLNEEYKIVELPEVSKTEHTLDNGKKYKSSIDEEAQTLTISGEDGKELCTISIADVSRPKHVVVCGNYLALSTERAGNYYIDIEKGEFFLEGAGYYGTEKNGVVRLMHGSGATAYYTFFNDDFILTTNDDCIYEMNNDGFWVYDEGTGEVKSYNLKGEVIEEYTGVESKWVLADDYFIFIFEDGSSKIISNEDGKISWELEFTEDMMYEGYFPHSYLEEGVGIVELEDGFYNLEGKMILGK